MNTDLKGNVLVNLKGQNYRLEFKDVLLNMKSPANLVSVIKLLELGWKVKEVSVVHFVLSKNEYELRARLNKHNLWELPISPVVNEGKRNDIVDNSISCLSIAQWHRNFAHQNFEYTKDLLNRLDVKYEKVPSDYQCVECKKGKATHLPFKTSVSEASEVGEQTHVDLLTSLVVSLGQSKYALVLKDDYSKYRTVYFSKSKEKTVEMFEDYFNRVKTQTGRNPRRVRSDNGTEEVNSEIDKLLSDLGIIHELSCPFTPEQNGRVERDMRTLSEAVGTVLIESGLEKKFWAEAMAYVVCTLNFVSKSSVENKTPYELFYQKEPYNVKQLKQFGTKVIVQVPKEKRKKFDPKGQEGIFIGYEMHTKGYKVFLKDKSTISVSRKS